MVLYSFLFSIFAVVFGSECLPTPDVLVGPELNVGQAYLYMSFCSIAFLLGYFALPHIKDAGTASVAEESKSGTNYISTKIMLLLLLICMTGIAVLLAQINSTVGVGEYFDIIRSVNSSDESNAIRFATIMLSSSDGGLPGMVKVFGECTVVGPFCLLALLARGARVRGVVNILLGMLIALCFIGGTLLKMDRLSLLALIPVTISVVLASKTRTAKIYTLCGILLLVLAMVLQSMRRGSELGIIGWVALYVRLGTVNLGLMIRTHSGFTYGFGGLFSVVMFVLRAFGVQLFSEIPTFDSTWNDAQSAFGYMFLDFGWYGFLAFLLAGAAGRAVDQKVRLASKLQTETCWREVQWIFSYAVLTIPIVPAYGGVEFWLLLLMSVLVARYSTRYLSLPSSRVPA